MALPNLGEDQLPLSSIPTATLLVSTGIVADEHETLDLPMHIHPTALNNVVHYLPPRSASTLAKATLTKVVHNRKYMDENPNIDTTKLKDEDLHDWKLVSRGRGAHAG